jgi:glycosyltransferase involved in cell wall biosynthesis
MISIFTSVMNRTERLKETIDNWLQYDWFDEIVVVDWSSEEEITIQHPKVKVFRVLDEPRWILTQSFNLAASLTKGDILVKMDADYRIDGKFGNIFPLPQGTYYHGAWFGPWSADEQIDDNAKYLNGFVACHRKDFESVNGYNERITRYGWDDSDLYQRMDKILTPLLITSETGIWHEPHDDNTRTVNQTGQNLGTDWWLNRQISKSTPWSIEDAKVQWIRDGHTIKRSTGN